MKASIIGSCVAMAIAVSNLHAAPRLLGVGELTGAADFSKQTTLLENGVDKGDALGGVGSGLAYAGNGVFLALPDRGPNAAAWETSVDNTTSYISRFQTIKMSIRKAPSDSALPLSISPQLQKTTLLYSPIKLNYGAVVPEANSPYRYYFSGRSDNFVGGDSLSVLDGRLDPEAIRVSKDRKSVYITDEYGPKVYEFDRSTGRLNRAFKLPTAFSAPKLFPTGAAEISENSTGRVANKGMEGLAITPDGSTLVGFEQSPLIQDGGDGGRANRIVTINIATGALHQYIYDNKLSDTKKSYNSSEILAINDHEFLVLERDGKGQGDNSSAVVKRLYKIDLTGAADISSEPDQGSPALNEANLLTKAVAKSLFLDIKTVLNANGYADTAVPAKLEGAAFGPDVKLDSGTYHTLWIANDNDFLPNTAGLNRFFVFGFTDSDIGGSFVPQQF
jgi:hypothetical protein